MADIAELIEVKDARSDKELQALHQLLLVSKARAPADWRSLRKDFTHTDWKPMLRVAPDDQFPYHAYAVYKGTHADREGRYANRDDAERNAIDYAAVRNATATRRDISGPNDD